MIPGLALILGWASMYSPSGYVTRLIDTRTPFPVWWDLYSVPGMAMLAVGVAAPVVYLYVNASLTSQDTALEMAALSAGASPVKALRTVTLPLLRPAILNSSVIVFALSLEVLGLPLILGSSSNVDMISTYLYDHWVNEVPSQQGLVSAGAIAAAGDGDDPAVRPQPDDRRRRPLRHDRQEARPAARSTSAGCAGR